MAQRAGSLWKTRRGLNLCPPGSVGWGTAPLKSPEGSPAAAQRFGGSRVRGTSLRSVFKELMHPRFDRNELEFALAEVSLNASQF
jgi:hypothetical protein